MNPKIAVSAKSIVIQQYLKGKSRDDIARGCGLSAGTISNIISEWRAKLGQYVVDLRELGINLKRSAMNPLQCARGFKIISMLETLGVDKTNLNNPRDASLYNEKIINDEIEAFSNLNTRLQKYGLDIGEDIPKFVQYK
jgi:hypothetical protein